MSSIVIYDSLFGNTEKIARVIHNGLAAYGPVRMVLAGEIALGDLDDSETLLILGSPTQDRTLSPDMIALMENAPRAILRGRAVAVFETRHDPRGPSGPAAQRLAGYVKPLGGRLILPPESFLLRGERGPLGPDELRRAAEWVGRVLDALARP